jgi:radical SAM superfamily enzyme YgiQ (UPF0313 family)
MELPKRARGDEFLPDGSYRRLAERLGKNPDHAEIRCLVVYCFDFRTRLLPFIYADRKMIPAGARAVAATLHEAGFTRTRIVLQQWNPSFRVRDALIDGRPPDVILLSAMQIHSDRMYEMIIDAHGMGANRPLIMCGGPKVIYEPEHVFSIAADGTMGPEGTFSADVVVTGEEYILLELLEAVSAHRAKSETMLQAFQRVRKEGTLNKIPGLVYEDPAPPAGAGRRLINTGIQRLVRDLDELPMPTQGFRMMEPPSSYRRGLSAQPMAAKDIWRQTMIASLITTHGCKFACNYCPIPAYNQRTWRTKSLDRMVREVGELNEHFGYRYFFGTDDNFFNTRSYVEEFFETFAKAEYKGKPIKNVFRYATEATEFDVYRNRDLLKTAKKAGLFAVWFGIEDMTAELINKGQTPEKTKELFAYMTKIGIAPMAMMMHHDDQPLFTRGGLQGLLNQANFLFNAGAVSYQCTILSPAVGTKVFEDTFLSGKMIKKINGEPVSQAMYDGNHAVASKDPMPWRRQLNLLAAYAMFYNPLNFLRRAFTRNKNQLRAVGYQLYGNLALPKTAWEMGKWAFKVAFGKKEYWKEVPVAPLPMVWVNEPGGKRPPVKPPAVHLLRPELGSELRPSAAAGA